MNFILLALFTLVFTACAFERHPYIRLPHDDAFERYPRMRLPYIPNPTDDDARNPAKADDFVKSESLLGLQDNPTKKPVGNMIHHVVKNYPLGAPVPENYFSIGFIQVPLSGASDLACLKQDPNSFGNLDDPSNYRGDVFMTEQRSSITAFIGIRSSGDSCIYIPVKQGSSFVEKLVLQINQLATKVDAFSNSTSVLIGNTTSDSTLLYAVIGIQFCAIIIACVFICYMKTRTVIEEALKSDDAPIVLVVEDNIDKV